MTKHIKNKNSKFICDKCIDDELLCDKCIDDGK